MHPHRQAKLLTYLGSIPFVLATLIAIYSSFDLAQAFDYEIKFGRFKSYALAHSYGALIVAFLAGIQWGISLPANPNNRYFISSNVLTLLSWFSLWLFAQWLGVALLALCFVIALLIDRHAFKAQMIPIWFWHLRLRISAVVITLLVIILIVNQ